MALTPKKLHFKNGQRNYIRYDGKPKMVIEVFSFTSMDLLKEASVKTSHELSRFGMPFLGSVTEWNGIFHLLVATQFIDQAPELTTQHEADKMARIMRKIADWYRYTVLNAQAN